MITRSFVTVAVALAATACAPMMWSRPGFSQAEAHSDYADCSRAAWQEANIFRWRRDFYRFNHFSRFDRRRRWHGSDDFDTFGLESDLTSFCMQSRGYSLVPVRPGPV